MVELAPNEVVAFPVKTKRDYKKALELINEILNKKAKKTSYEKNFVTVMSLQIQHYEQLHYTIELPEPIEAIKIRMKDLQYSPSQLAEYIGISSSTMRKILNRHVPLNLSHIRKLSNILGLSIDALCQEYELATTTKKTHSKSLILTGTPPDGLALNATTGAITGTPIVSPPTNLTWRDVRKNLLKNMFLNARRKGWDRTIYCISYYSDNFHVCKKHPTSSSMNLVEIWKPTKEDRQACDWHLFEIGDKK